MSTHAEHDQVERRVPADLSCVVVDGIDLGQRVCGTSNAACTQLIRHIGFFFCFLFYNDVIAIYSWNVNKIIRTVWFMVRYLCLTPDLPTSVYRFKNSFQFADGKLNIRWSTVLNLSRYHSEQWGKISSLFTLVMKSYGNKCYLGTRNKLVAIVYNKTAITV